METIDIPRKNNKMHTPPADQVQKERLELTVSKEKLQLAIWVIGALFSILAYFSIRILSGIDTLKENSADFKTYIKTNDQRVMYLEQDFKNHIIDSRKHDDRLKELEDNDAQFWKDYGWLFRESQQNRNK